MSAPVQYGDWQTITIGGKIRALVLLLIYTLLLVVCVRGLRSAFQRVVRDKTVVEEFDDWCIAMQALLAVIRYNETRVEYHPNGRHARSFVNFR